jgi:hypothetical protein
MTSTVKRSVPPPCPGQDGQPAGAYAPWLAAARVLDDSFLVLHLTGRKTGRRYDIPVGYVTWKDGSPSSPSPGGGSTCAAEPTSR